MQGRPNRASQALLGQGEVSVQVFGQFGVLKEFSAWSRYEDVARSRGNIGRHSCVEALWWYLVAVGQVVELSHVMFYPSLVFICMHTACHEFGWYAEVGLEKATPYNVTFRRHNCVEALWWYLMAV
ncbi:hypothetical protein Taro_026177, partial [Colocasia esculenta]|nr:hypothetical protein [Colocasia esculenta]